MSRLLPPRFFFFFSVVLTANAAGCSLAIDRALDEHRDAGPDSGPSSDAFSCDLTAADDAVSRTYVLTSLTLPGTHALGFDLDGLASTTRNDGAGCGHVDGFPGGVDNAVAELVNTYGGVLEAIDVDLRSAIASSLTRDEITLEIADWNGTRSDECIRVTIRGTHRGAPFTSISGSTPMLLGRVNEMRLYASLPIDAAFPGQADGESVHIPLVIRELRLRLAFGGGTDAMGSLVAVPPGSNRDTSMLGGHVERKDGMFADELDALIAARAPALALSFRNVLDAALDLHASPMLTPCSFEDPRMVLPDALSIGLLLTGDQR